MNMENRLQNGKYDTTLIEGPMWKCGTRAHTRAHTHTHTHTHTHIAETTLGASSTTQGESSSFASNLENILAHMVQFTIFDGNDG